MIFRKAARTAVRNFKTWIAPPRRPADGGLEIWERAERDLNEVLKAAEFYARNGEA